MCFGGQCGVDNDHDVKAINSTTDDWHEQSPALSPIGPIARMMLQPPNSTDDASGGNLEERHVTQPHQGGNTMSQLLACSGLVAAFSRQGGSLPAHVT